MYAQHDRNENLLNHFAILDALRVSQDLLDCGVHLAAAGADELGVGPVPSLDLADHRLEALLVDSHLHDDAVVGTLAAGPDCALQAHGALMP